MGLSGRFLRLEIDLSLVVLYGTKNEDADSGEISESSG